MKQKPLPFCAKICHRKLFSGLTFSALLCPGPCYDHFCPVCSSTRVSSGRFPLRGGHHMAAWCSHDKLLGHHTTPCLHTFHPFAASRTIWSSYSHPPHHPRTQALEEFERVNWQISIVAKEKHEDQE